MLRKLRAGAGEHDASTEGFTLLEMMCVMAIIGMLVAISLPSIPVGASGSRVQGYAIEIASLLVADRDAAIAERRIVSTQIDVASGLVRSGSTKRIVQISSDLTFSATLADSCDNILIDRSVVFFPSGMSCGGSVSILRAGSGFDINVNWLTGVVEVVPHSSL